MDCSRAKEIIDAPDAATETDRLAAADHRDVCAQCGAFVGTVIDLYRRGVVGRLLDTVLPIELPVPEERIDATLAVLKRAGLVSDNPPQPEASAPSVRIGRRRYAHSPSRSSVLHPALPARLSGVDGGRTYWLNYPGIDSQRDVYAFLVEGEATDAGALLSEQLLISVRGKARISVPAGPNHDHHRPVPYNGPINSDSMVQSKYYAKHHPQSAPTST